MNTATKLNLATAKLRDCAATFDHARRHGDDLLSEYDWDNALNEVQRTLALIEGDDALRSAAWAALQALDLLDDESAAAALDGVRRQLSRALYS